MSFVFWYKLASNFLNLWLLGVHEACLYLFLFSFTRVVAALMLKWNMACKIFRRAVFRTFLTVSFLTFEWFIYAIFIFEDDNKLRFYINTDFVFIGWVIFLLAKIIVAFTNFFRKIITFLL